ncbi:MAG: cysteine--1-D-myo-inosityl 2-amino-2-deoxy-alpha-D-glucopyranoside ligase [Catenulisporales bacterium]|nr:cysteine--1-D-myo-inosityl 2-amino-2-deoxy-alpha-D-glucopyranoside ligase [Catenulisporales bacterium]
MHAWPAPEVPELPGHGPAVRLHDTAARALVATPAAAPGERARIYVCGITPYDATHMGHANTYLAFDLIQRAWRDAGHPVSYVQNVTDVDDPLLERAAANGQDWEQLAAAETALFREDMTALRILPPEHYVGAVESIPLVVDLVVKLLERGAAYDVDGDVYFSVHADPAFGSVSHLDAAKMLTTFAERGGDPGRPGKKHQLDCLLWQAEREGEPAWDPGHDGRVMGLRPGRPGWHIECAAIALEHLGMGLDLQGGGSDLAFPHHEMGASEAQVVTGERPYAQTYVHSGMVGLDGAKMSKSKGNLVLVSKLRHAGVDPMAIRLALLAHHYRTDWDWTDADLESAQARLARWRAAVSRPDAVPADDVLDAVRERMAEDLDTPGALAVIDAWAARQEAADLDAAEPAERNTAAPGQISRIADALLGVAL